MNNKNIKIVPCNITEHGRWKRVEEVMEEYIQSDIELTIISFCDIYFNDTKDVIKDKWIGFIHNPLDFEKYIEWKIEPLFEKKHFLESLKYCKALIVMSNPLKDFYLKKIKELGLNIVIEYIPHPMPLMRSTKKWRYHNYIENKEIVAIGNWLRKTYTIFKIKGLGHTKSIVPYSNRTRIELLISCIKGNININDEEYNSVIKYAKMNNECYECLLESSLVLLDVFKTSINNTLLECICINTPIILTRCQEFIDVLGPDYPLFFNNVYEIDNLINDSKNIVKAHLHIKEMNKTFLTEEYFIERLKEIILKINEEKDNIDLLIKNLEEKNKLLNENKLTKMEENSDKYSFRLEKEDKTTLENLGHGLGVEKIPNKQKLFIWKNV
jgi:hypothetical protein